VVRPVALEVGTGDFAFAASRRRIAISLLAGTLNFAGGFIDPQFRWRGNASIARNARAVNVSLQYCAI
jgi:hypothetical protein